MGNISRTPTAGEAGVADRLAYHPPILEHLGSVADLTAGPSESGSYDGADGYTASAAS
jgi:hypothetical protein